MRRLVQIILLKPILWFSRKFTSRPERYRIFKALSDLFRSIKEEPGKKGVILDLKENSRIIIFSDHHRGDRKSTRLNSSHSQISYAVFCLKKKKNKYYK